MKIGNILKSRKGAKSKINALLSTQKRNIRNKKSSPTCTVSKWKRAPKTSNPDLYSPNEIRTQSPGSPIPFPLYAIMAACRDQIDIDCSRTCCPISEFLKHLMLILAPEVGLRHRRSQLWIECVFVAFHDHVMTVLGLWMTFFEEKNNKSIWNYKRTEVVRGG